MQLIFYKKQAKIGGATKKNIVKFWVEEVRKMKFGEKLTNLRKQNNQSQEQIADKLGVSRQAVSKWESGVSVPDMEKMMQLCKILNCSLDELVDDGAGGNRKQNSQAKPTWNTYYKEVIDFITKTLNMFWSMNLIEKIKCLLEMTFLTLILFCIWGIVGNIIYSCFNPLLNLFPTTVYLFIYSVCSFIYKIFGIIAGFVLLVHIFKIRYLDYFITIEDENVQEKIVEVPIDESEQITTSEFKRQCISKRKNKIIIRDPKHSTYNFFGILAKLVILFIKFLLILFAIPCVISFVIITFLGICSIWYLNNGIIFLGIFITILGALLINYLVLKIIYYFIFELKQTFRKTFVLLIIGLVLIGGGGSIFCCTYLNFDKVLIDSKEQVTTHHELEYEDRMILSFLNYENVTVVEDNEISNIKIDIEHDADAESSIYSEQHYTTMINENDDYIDIVYDIYDFELFYKDEDAIDEINFLLQMLKDKERFSFGDDNAFYHITIITSRTIIDNLNKNYSEFYE